MVGRMVAQGLTDRLGQSVVVDNRGGAGGLVGVDTVAKAAPDGYTLCLCSAGAMISTALLASKPPYDPRRDFAPVSMLAIVPYVLLVNPVSGPANVQALVAAARQKPGSLNYGSAGSGSTSHLAAAQFVAMAGIDVMHVPFKGSTQANTELAAGRLSFVFEAIGAGTQYVRSGRLRGIGVSTLKRSPGLPEVPTIDEQGVTGYEMITWHSLCVPRGTPAAIIERLNREIVAVMNAPELRERFVAVGTEPGASTPAQLKERIEREVGRYEKLLTQLGLRGA
jgi:tripartite-type tricarboxylate transporter receptor subunit TctC